jgi:hypothetical protein
MFMLCGMYLGKRLVDTILEQHGKWPKTLPKVTDRAVAIAIGEHFLMHETSFFVRADRVDKDKGILMVSCSKCRRALCSSSGRTVFRVFIVLPSL